MKTKVLFAAALLLSTVSFAQEATAKSEQSTTISTAASNSASSRNANINSSSNATVKTSTADKAAQKTEQTKQEAKKTAATQKEALVDETNTDVKAAQKTVRDNDNGSGGVHADAQVGAESNNNKVSQDASLSNQATVSGESVKSSGKEVKKEGQASLNTETASTIQTTNHVEKQTESSLIKTSANVKKEAEIVDGNVKTNAKASATTAIKAGAGIPQAVKPKPASLKMKTQLEGNAGLKIK